MINMISKGSFMLAERPKKLKEEKFMKHQI